MSYKQVIIVRSDLKLPKGKTAAQAAHASVETVIRMINDNRREKEKVEEWRREGMAKIVLKCADEKELLKLNQEAKERGIITAVITDAGKTVVAPGTRTCMAAGPEKEEIIDEIFGQLKLL